MKISVSLEMPLKLGEFQYAKIGAMAESDLEEMKQNGATDQNLAYSMLQAMVRQQVLREMQHISNQTKEEE